MSLRDTPNLKLFLGTKYRRYSPRSLNLPQVYYGPASQSTKAAGDSTVTRPLSERRGTRLGGELAVAPPDPRRGHADVALRHSRRCALAPVLDLREQQPDPQQYDRKLMLMYDGLEAHAQECVEFAAAIAEGRPSPVPPEQSLQVMKILDGIYRSQEAGGEIRLD